MVTTGISNKKRDYRCKPDFKTLNSAINLARFRSFRSRSRIKFKSKIRQQQD